MSWLYYFASDSPLEERPNPYIKRLSIREAMAQGVEVTFSLVQDRVDIDRPGAILVCEREEDMEYPNIFSFCKDDYNEAIGTEKKHCTALEWNCREEHTAVVLEYIRGQLEHSPELELWRVWLGAFDIPARRKRTLCRGSDLTVEGLNAFFQEDNDCNCLVIVP